MSERACRGLARLKAQAIDPPIHSGAETAGWRTSTVPNRIAGPEHNHPEQGPRVRERVEIDSFRTETEQP
ncbi:hypothetical protein CVV72_01205 [Amycolatopsis sp. TNS106]|nr:hypothetical protein CVV72_01205 [Amycolatopsis sp. TNS106]